MNSRLSQDAADTLAWHDKWRNDALARREASRPSVIVGTWKPTISEQERKEREQQIAIGALPF